MSAGGSITRWLGLFRAGDRAAAQPLWEAYCGRLAALARRTLQDAPRQAADEEDAALSAFDSFCRRAERGQFPQLRDRNDLWQVLVMLTARKAGQLARNSCREKRGGGKILLETDLAAADGSGEDGLAQVVGREPTPDFAAQVAEELHRLLDRLDDPGLLPRPGLDDLAREVVVTGRDWRWEVPVLTALAAGGLYLAGARPVPGGPVRRVRARRPRLRAGDGR
jgi:hypothetical protein